MRSRASPLTCPSCLLGCPPQHPPHRFVCPQLRLRPSLAALQHPPDFALLLILHQALRMQGCVFRSIMHA